MDTTGNGTGDRTGDRTNATGDGTDATGTDVKGGRQKFSIEG
jgi:hypothetical protein